jgi:hypothetical protein
LERAEVIERPQPARARESGAVAPQRRSPFAICEDRAVALLFRP